MSGNGNGKLVWSIMLGSCGLVATIIFVWVSTIQSSVQAQGEESKLTRMSVAVLEAQWVDLVNRMDRFENTQAAILTEVKALHRFKR